MRVHVGDDEVLLDDSRRYVERAVAADVDAKPDVWTGMSHGFVTHVGGFNAAREALSAIGAFLPSGWGARSDENLSTDAREARSVGHHGNAWGTFSVAPIF